MTDASVIFDVKSFIKDTAVESGMTADAALEFAEKCYDGMPMAMWQPYGGAKSFAEIDLQRASDDYNMHVSMLTGALQGVISNVTNSEDLGVSEKAAAIQAAATEYEARVQKLDATRDQSDEIVNGGKSLGKGFLESVKAKLKRKKPEGSDPLMTPNTEAMTSMTKNKAVAIGEGFKMYIDTEGDLRWLAFSSNAFEDGDKELFSTKALEEAVKYGDETGSRGPLQVFHIPGTQIGECDFQAMSGRFLVESGKFDNSPMGQKAVEYLVEHPEEEWQVSIGYFYKEGDDADGVYDWTRIKERSILPKGTAANPWTEFKMMGDINMHSKAKETLTKLFGPDITSEVVATAEARTKELEANGTRFKAETEAVKMAPEEFGEITGIEVITAPAGAKAAEPVFETIAHEHGTVRHTHRVKMASEHDHQDLPEAYKAKKTPAADAEDKADGGKDDDQEDANGKKAPPFAKKEGDESFDVKGLATVLGDLVASVEDLKSIGAKMATIEESIKELKDTDENRMAAIMAPRFTLPGGVRPTEAVTNVVTNAETIQGLKQGDEPEGEKNPAQVYVDDLLGVGPRIQQG